MRVKQRDKSKKGPRSETMPEYRQLSMAIPTPASADTTLAEQVLKFVDQYLPETPGRNISGQEES
jgi:hypothetical protein